MTVFCGPSSKQQVVAGGADTIYAGGQPPATSRVCRAAPGSSWSQVQKPKVEHVTGLSPAISIEQKTTSKSPRSTVGTVTEIYDYLRILYARLGQRALPAVRPDGGTRSRGRDR